MTHGFLKNVKNIICKYLVLFLDIFLLISNLENIYIYIFFFLRRRLHYLQVECSGAILAHCNFCFPVSSNSLASASQVFGTIAMYHHTRLIFLVFLVEMGFHHVGQDGLDLLTSGSAHLSLPKCWYYRHEPLCPASYVVLSDFIKKQLQ